MKVLIVMDSLFTGGAEYSTLLWASWLKERGNEVQLVLLKKKGLEYDPVDFNITVDRLRSGRWYGRYVQLKALIKEYSPDIVHSVLTASNFLCRIIRLSGRQFVHIESLVNQPYSVERLKNINLQPWKIHLLRRFDHFSQRRGVQYFHANSIAVAEHYESAVGVPSSKMSVVPRGRDENPFLHRSAALSRYYRRRFSVPPTHVLLLTTGRHEYQKGQDILLKAMHLMLQQGIKATLLIAGREGAFTPLLRRIIHDLNLGSHVHLLGHRSDIAQLLVAADIFVFPSRYEGLPGALVEACAASLPIVCTDLACIREVIEPGRNALVIEAEDTTALASAIVNLARCPERRNAFGQQSQDIFQRKFNSEKIHAAMMEMYGSILSEVK